MKKLLLIALLFTATPALADVDCQHPAQAPTKQCMENTINNVEPAEPIGIVMYKAPRCDYFIAYNLENSTFSLSKHWRGAGVHNGFYLYKHYSTSAKTLSEEGRTEIEVGYETAVVNTVETNLTVKDVIKAYLNRC